MFDVSLIREALAKHGAVTRIVVVDHKGSTPRETGTAMLVWDGGQSGTIGGGALEYQAVDAARKTRAPTVLSMPLGPALAQCCGGAVTLVLEPITDLPETGQPHARRITGTADRPLAITRALAEHRSKGLRPKVIWADGWLLEPTTEAQTPVWIYGAGHVGRALVDTFDGLPMAVTWVDTGPERFPEGVRPDVTVLPASDPVQATRLAPDEAHHLILTYSHRLDLDLCHALLNRPAAYIGLIGSATKWARFRKRLTGLGHDATTVAQITCPIGDPALGKEPKAIALGVAAQLLQSARRGQGKRESA